MVVGADGLVWVFHKLLIYWDFHTQPSLEFTENDPKKTKAIIHTDHQNWTTEDWKTLHGLMSLDFCWDIQM